MKRILSVLLKFAKKWVYDSFNHESEVDFIQRVQSEIKNITIERKQNV
jgi:hypothetical protein